MKKHNLFQEQLITSIHTAEFKPIRVKIRCEGITSFLNIIWEIEAEHLLIIREPI